MHDFVPVIGGILVVAIPAFLGGLWTRRKTKAETTDVITQAAERVVTQLTRALDQAQATANRLGAEAASAQAAATAAQAVASRLSDDVISLQAEIARLRDLVVQLGGDPSKGRRSVDL